MADDKPKNKPKEYRTFGGDVTKAGKATLKKGKEVGGKIKAAPGEVAERGKHPYHYLTEWRARRKVKKAKKEEDAANKLSMAGPEGALLGGFLKRKAQKAKEKAEELKEKAESGGGRKKHSAVRIIGIIFIVLIALFFFTYNAVGRIYFQEATTEVGILTEEVGAEARGPLNVIKQLAVGTYDPSSLWESQRIVSQESPKDTGVKIRNLGSPKTIYIGEELIVHGDIDVISGLNKNTQLYLTGYPFRVCVTKTGNYLAEFADVARGDLDIDLSETFCTPHADWDCLISGVAGNNNAFTVGNIYNRNFECRHPGFSNLDEDTYIPVDIYSIYITEASAERLFYTSSSKILGTKTNPISEFGIDQSTLVSKYIGEDNVELGVGLDLNDAFIRTYSAEDAYQPTNWIGISVKNDGDGDLINITYLYIVLPYNKYFIYYETADMKLSPESEEAILKGKEPEHIIFIIRDNVRARVKANEPLSSFEHNAYYVGIKIHEDYLSDTNYQSFTITSGVGYHYREKSAVDIKVNSAPVDGDEAIREIPYGSVFYKCSGTEDSCEELSYTNCEYQIGCSLNATSSCVGTALSCISISSQEQCGDSLSDGQRGCAWGES